MIKSINESKTLKKHISYECRWDFNSRKCNSREKWNKDKYQCECKHPVKNRACERNMCLNKDCEIVK